MRQSRRPPEQPFHDLQPRPHPHHPCRQPAAQREAVRPADGAGGRQAVRPEGAGRRDGQGGAPRRRRRRWTPASTSATTASSGRIGFQTYVPQRMSGFAGVSKRRRGLRVRGIPRAARLPDAALPQSDQEPAGRAGGAGRHQVSRPQADHRRDRGLQQDRRRARRVLRALHDRGLARHHLDHDAQRALRVARRLSRRDRARDEQGIPGDPQGRARSCRSTRPISRWTAP